jgi:hypothetical protein|tara:strand:+ start:2158 stop:2445 length:288 start_codon:yes stop_codon:yes gene_type:complete
LQAALSNLQTLQVTRAAALNHVHWAGITIGGKPITAVGRDNDENASKYFSPDSIYCYAHSGKLGNCEAGIKASGKSSSAPGHHMVKGGKPVPNFQ